MINLEFIGQNVPVPELKKDVVREWLCEVVRLHGKTAGRLTYIFCDDDYILETNKKYLNHDYFTDIITFDYSTCRRVSGDMVISLDTVRTNADKFGVGYEDELLRVIVHGMLHLCGINDKGEGEREIMEHHENEALRLLKQDAFNR